MKRLVKHLLFYSGLIRLAHRFRNRQTLTIIMLHRILPEDKIKEYGANPEWSMTPEVFENFLIFIKKYYTPVSVEEIEDSFKHSKQLPANAILISFDDGWRDNYQYASKYLLDHQVPSIIFIVTNTINQQLPFWQELVYSCCVKSSSDFLQCIKLSGMDNCDSILTFISELSNNPDYIKNKDRVIEYCSKVKSNLPRQLMDEQEILELHKHKYISIGSHGASHNLLGNMSQGEQWQEISSSRDVLEKITRSNIRFLSFPHGSNNAETLLLCQQAKFSLMFDSKVAINHSHSTQLARVHVSQRSITEKGKFSRIKAAYRLFFLPHV